MSAAVKAIVYLLTHNTGLNAVVPAAKIMPGAILENTVLPAISVMHISTIRQHALGSNESEFCASRVQITVMATSYASQSSIMALVRSALPYANGTINGVVIDSILHQLDGPDFFDDEVKEYMGSIDYTVNFIE